LSETERQPPNYFLQDVPPPRGNTLSEMERQPPNYLLQDLPPPRGNILSEMERQPPNYFLQDVPPPRGNTLSEMERQPPNNFLQDVPPPRGNSLSEMERQPPNYFLQDVPPPPRKYFVGDGASAPELLPAGRATSPRKYFVGDGASAPELLLTRRATSPRKYFVGDGASAPELLPAGRATSPRKYFVGDGASAPELLPAGRATPRRGRSVPHSVTLIVPRGEVVVSFGSVSERGGEWMQMATSPPPARKGAAPASPLTMEPSAEMLADFPQRGLDQIKGSGLGDVPPWAHAFQAGVCEMAKAEFKTMVKAEFKTMLTELQSTLRPWQTDVQMGIVKQAVEHAKTQHGLAEVKTELAEVKAELRSGASQASHIATLQLQLAEQDAMLVEEAATNAKWAARDAKQVELETIRANEMAELRVRKATPPIAGADFRKECVAWFESYGMAFVPSNTQPHCADGMITIPGHPDKRVLVDFKAGQFAAKAANLQKLGGDFALREEDPDLKCDFAMLLYNCGELDDGYASEPCCAMNPSPSGGFSDVGDMHVDRAFICDTSTFFKAMFLMVKSLPVVADDANGVANLMPVADDANGVAYVHELTLASISMLAKLNESPVHTMCAAAAKMGPYLADLNQLNKNDAHLKIALKRDVFGLDAALRGSKAVYLTQVPTGDVLGRTLYGRGDKGDVERKIWKPDVDAANAVRVSINSTQLTLAAALTKKEKKEKKRGRGEW